MRTITRRTATVAAALATAAATIGFAPAQGAAQEADQKSNITVRSSDYEVDSGEQFILRGRMASKGRSLSGATVRVQTYRNGDWVPVTGAVVKTGSDGRYRVRVILESGGDRDLRVVGNPWQDDIRISRDYTVVRVLG
jgi:hypothetical protein